VFIPPGWLTAGGAAANAVAVILNSGNANNPLAIRYETQRDFAFTRSQPFVMPKGSMYSHSLASVIPLFSGNSLLDRCFTYIIVLSCFSGKYLFLQGR